MIKKKDENDNYLKSNLKIISVLLLIWFISSFGLGVIFVDWLNQFKVAGFKLGFWFAQQGSIYTFVILIFVYVYLMHKLDKKYKSSRD